MSKPLYKQFGLDPYDQVACPFCRQGIFARSLGAHVCRKAPGGGRRQITNAEWSEVIRSHPKAKGSNMPVAENAAPSPRASKENATALSARLGEKASFPTSAN